MNIMPHRLILLAGVLVLVSCGSIKQYETTSQPLNQTLRTYIGGTILEVEKEESLPNAFGGADIYGGRRATGSVELKYLGLADDQSAGTRIFRNSINCRATLIDAPT